MTIIISEWVYWSAAIMAGLTFVAMWVASSRGTGVLAFTFISVSLVWLYWYESYSPYLTMGVA